MHAAVLRGGRITAAGRAAHAPAVHLGLRTSSAAAPAGSLRRHQSAAAMKADLETLTVPQLKEIVKESKGIELRVARARKAALVEAIVEHRSKPGFDRIEGPRTPGLHLGSGELAPKPEGQAPTTAAPLPVALRGMVRPDTANVLATLASVQRGAHTTPAVDVGAGPDGPRLPHLEDASAAELAPGLVTEALAAAPVVMFSKTFCPHCTEVHKLLSKMSLTQQPHIVELDLLEWNKMEALQDHLGELTGARSVPRVFIGGEFIGGAADTLALGTSGGLSELLIKAGALPKAEPAVAAPVAAAAAAAAPKSVGFPGVNTAAAAAAAPSSFVLERLSALPVRAKRQVAAAAAPGSGEGPKEPRASPEMYIGAGELAPQPFGSTTAAPTGPRYSPVETKKLAVKEHLDATAAARPRVPSMAEVEVARMEAATKPVGRFNFDEPMRAANKVAQTKTRAPSVKTQSVEGSAGRFNFNQPMNALGEAAQSKPQVANAAEALAQPRTAAVPAPRVTPTTVVPDAAAVKPPTGRFNFDAPMKALGEVAATKTGVSENAAGAFAQKAQRAGLKRHTRGGARVAAAKLEPATSPVGRFNFDEPMRAANKVAQKQSGPGAAVTLESAEGSVGRFNFNQPMNALGEAAQTKPQVANAAEALAQPRTAADPAPRATPTTVVPDAAAVKPPTGRFNFKEPMRAAGNVAQATGRSRLASGTAAEAEGAVGRFNFDQPMKAAGETATGGGGGASGAGGSGQAKPQVSANAVEALAQHAQRAALKRHTRSGPGVGLSAAPKPEPATGPVGRFNFDEPMRAANKVAQVKPRAPTMAEAEVAKMEAGTKPVGRFNFDKPMKALGKAAQAQPQVSANAAEAFVQTAQRMVLKRHTRAGPGAGMTAASKPASQSAALAKPAAPAGSASGPVGRFNFDAPMKVPKPGQLVKTEGGSSGGGGGGGMFENIKSKVSELSQAQIAAGALALWTVGLINMYRGSSPKEATDVDIHRSYIAEIGYLKAASLERDDLAMVVSLVERLTHIEEHVSSDAKQANPRRDAIVKAKALRVQAARAGNAGNYAGMKQLHADARSLQDACVSPAVTEKEITTKLTVLQRDDQMAGVAVGVMLGAVGGLVLFGMGVLRSK